MRYWDMTLNGEHLFYFSTKANKIDIGALYQTIIKYVGTTKKFLPGQLMLKSIKGFDDMGCIELK